MSCPTCDRRLASLRRIKGEVASVARMLAANEDSARYRGWLTKVIGERQRAAEALAEHEAECEEVARG